MKYTDLARLVHALPTDQTVLLLGKPGIGKTALGRDVARMMTEAKRQDDPKAPEAVCHVIDLSSSLPEDISGLPFPQGDVTEYKPTAWVHDLCKPDAYGVLILDDLPAATQAVQVACRQIALEHRVHRFVFSSGVRVIVTGNRREDKSAATVLPAHFRNSCVMLQVEPDVKEWAAWALGKGIPGVIPAYLRFRQNNLAMLPSQQDEQGQFATPRTWAMLGRSLDAAVKNASVLEVASGLVGSGAATDFEAFRKLRHELPEPADVLADPKKHVPTPPTEPDRLIAYTTAIAEYVAAELRTLRAAARTAILTKFLLALAHLTRSNREDRSAAVHTFSSIRAADGKEKDALFELATVAGTLRKENKDVEELLRFIAVNVR